MQAAWSQEGNTPRWVPMRSAPLRRDAPRGAASSPAAGASTPRDVASFLALLAKGGPCDDFVEPDWIDAAFGTPRHYRLCGQPIRVLHAGAPTWLLRNSEGAVAVRVGYGRGDITANALEGSFDNRALVRDDGAISLEAAQAVYRDLKSFDPQVQTATVDLSKTIDMALAYENLPDSLKIQLGLLEAVHDLMPAFGPRMTPEQREANRTMFPPVVHPVVRTHPESGEQILYVNEAFTTHLANYATAFEPWVGVDFKVAEMDLLRLLLRQATIPEYQMRLHWTPNTLVIWDNRATQHYAIQDYFPAVRRMMRATVIGDRPR